MLPINWHTLLIFQQWMSLLEETPYIMEDVIFKDFYKGIRGLGITPSRCTTTFILNEFLFLKKERVNWINSAK